MSKQLVHMGIKTN